MNVMMMSMLEARLFLISELHQTVAFLLVRRSVRPPSTMTTRVHSNLGRFQMHGAGRGCRVVAVPVAIACAHYPKECEAAIALII